MGKIFFIVIRGVRYAIVVYPALKSIFKMLWRKKRMNDHIEQDGEYGIKETLEGLDFIIPFANTIDNTTKDGFKWTEIIEFVPALTKLPTAIGGGKIIPKEIGDLSDMEHQQLIDKVKELDFDDANAEIVGEKAMAALVALGELIVAIRNSK